MRRSLFVMILGSLAAALQGRDYRLALQKGQGSQTWKQATPIAGGPLRKHPLNPRYFTDASSRAIYLTGSHFWTTIQSWNPDKVRASGPYEGGPAFATFREYIEFLQERHHNFTRLWCFDSFSYESSPSPWLRTGPGAAFDDRPKWDVSRINPAYLAQLRDRVQQFRDNGIYVSVMFFRGNSAVGTHPVWDAHPFKPSNNINVDLADLTFDTYNSLRHQRTVELQKQYMRSVIDALNDMDNVIWEIANEAQPGSYAWQQHLAEYVRSYERDKPNQHLVGITSTYPNNNRELYASNADWIAPGIDGYDPENPPPADGSKIIFSDTDHHLLRRATPGWAWKSFLRGEHPILMENELAWDFEDLRWAMGNTRTLAEQMNLAEMTPQNAASDTAYALVNPGVEYLIYSPRASRFWVDLSRGAGKRFAVEWVNPRTGACVPGATIVGGLARESFSAPLNDFGAVLHLRSLDADPLRVARTGQAATCSGNSVVERRDNR